MEHLIQTRGSQTSYLTLVTYLVPGPIKARKLMMHDLCCYWDMSAHSLQHWPHQTKFGAEWGRTLLMIQGACRCAPEGTSRSHTILFCSVLALAGSWLTKNWETGLCHPVLLIKKQKLSPPPLQLQYADRALKATILKQIFGLCRLRLSAGIPGRWQYSPRIQAQLFSSCYVKDWKWDHMDALSVSYRHFLKRHVAIWQSANSNQKISWWSNHLASPLQSQHSFTQLGKTSKVLLWKKTNKKKHLTLKPIAHQLVVCVNMCK